MADLSHFLRLVPVQLGELPSHPALDPSSDLARGRNMHRKSESSQLQGADPQTAAQSVLQPGPDIPTADQRPPIRAFIKAILDAAVVFIDDTLPTTFKEHSNKPSMAAKTRVELLQRTISAKELSKVDWQGSEVPRHPPANVASETWFARRSHHANQQADHTAQFFEFDHGLRIRHCEHEGEYTPEIYDTYRVLDWEISDALARVESGFTDYQNITMSIFEMCHKLPFPLSTRVFSVLVITATTGREDFIVVQLPVEIDTLKEAFYSNGRNITEGSSALKRKKPIMGQYTSIERCIKRPISNDIEWTMATTSDAKGWLPMWAQKMGVPGAIAKDVDFLMNWIREKRPLERL
ncbi:MAG: hypothetical protein Q9168_000290 [Polycauliona sp. 1 TL-2023]